MTGWKTYFGIGLAVAGVFGATVISQFTVKPPKKADDASVADAGDAAPAGGPALVFPAAEIHFDPYNEDLRFRTFPGFYEIGRPDAYAGFWFSNPTSKPVAVAAGTRSCTSCTSAKIAVVPDDVLAEYAKYTAVAFFPAGGFPLPDLLSPLAAVQFDRALQWQALDFEDKTKAFIVPAATGKDRPTRGILAVGFASKTAAPPKTITAGFATAAEGQLAHTVVLTVTYIQQNAFILTPPTTNLGWLTAAEPEKTFDVFVISSTRGPADLPPPAVRVGGDDPLVVVAPPRPIPDADLAGLERQMSLDNSYPVRIKSGYSLRVTVRREAPGLPAEIGSFEKELFVTVPGTGHSGSVRFTGKAAGAVRLEDGEKIAVGTYNADFEAKKTARVFAEKTGVELEIDAAASTPKFAKYSLDPASVEGGRTYWTVRTVIPANLGRRPSWDGTLVLKAKGAVNATVRIPVSGNGVAR